VLIFLLVARSQRGKRAEGLLGGEGSLLAWEVDRGSLKRSIRIQCRMLTTDTTSTIKMASLLDNTSVCEFLKEAVLY
jgi:hypothetical protein